MQNKTILFPFTYCGTLLTHNSTMIQTTKCHAKYQQSLITAGLIILEDLN